jgi:hypothetical protein
MNRMISDLPDLAQRVEKLEKVNLREGVSGLKCAEDAHCG